MCVQRVRAVPPSLHAAPRPSRSLERGRGAAQGEGHPRVRRTFTGRSQTAPQPGPSTALPVSSVGGGPPSPSPRGTIPTMGPTGAPHPRIAGKPRAVKDGEGAGSPVLLGRAGTPPNLSRSLPDPGASAVRGERGWAPGPQQLENSLRETIKVDYPVGSWSGNYLVN